MLPGHGKRYSDLFAGGIGGLILLGAGLALWHAAQWWWKLLAG